jgi:Heparan-alpha-glucosaminide N-acetyltransferase, catalytic
MLLACLSHVLPHFETQLGLQHITRIATPTFLLVSGFVIGHLLRTDTRGGIRVTVLDRGLFLVLVVHLLFGVWTVTEDGVLRWFFGSAFITDTIGFGLLVAVLLRAAPAAVLTALAVVMCLGSWWVANTLSADHEWTQRVGAILFDQRTGDIRTNAPVIPYVGVFLMGMALSLHLKPLLLARADREVARRLFYFGAAAILAVVLGILAWHFGKEYLPDLMREPDVARFVRASLDPRSKHPPGPGYLLFYGGMSLLMLALFWRGQPRGLLDPIIRVTAVIGKASLMCFVLQDWLLIVLPRLLGFSAFNSTGFWGVYAAASLTIMYWLSKRWNELNGNRFLTVGLQALARRRSTPVRVPAASRRAA